MADALIRFMENIGENQLDRLASRKKLLVLFSRQGPKQTICGGARFARSTADSPAVLGKPTGGTRRVEEAIPMSDADQMGPAALHAQAPRSEQQFNGA